MVEKIKIKGKTYSGLSMIEIHDGEHKDEIWSFRDIRIGLHWPTATSPGFFCLVGQSIRNFEGHYPLRLLREAEESIPSALFEKMADAAGSFSCEEVDCDISEKFKGFVLDFYAFKKRERPNQRLFLRQAPFHSEFVHGTLLIKDFFKRNDLVIPRETILHRQLGSITDDDLTRDAPERFWALDAFRHVISSFEVTGHLPHRGNMNHNAPPAGAFF